MKLRGENITTMNKCPICKNLFREVASIQNCCGRFCLDCIMKKISEEDLQSCPECTIKIGSAQLQELREQLAKEKFDADSEQVQEDAKISGEISVLMEEDDPVDHPMTETLSSDEKQTNSPEMSDPEVVDDVPKENRSNTKDDSAWTKGIEERVAQVLAQFRETEEVMADESIKKVESFWFALVASDKQKTDAPLDQIPSKYLRVRDGSITVSSIKKYLVQKLNLTSENEVEVSMRGRRLKPTVEVNELLNLWVHKASTSNTMNKTFIGCSAEDFVMTLTYGRNLKL